MKPIEKLPSVVPSRVMIEREKTVCEDAISRKWVLNEIITKVEDDDSLTDEQRDSLSAAKHLIRHAPPVEPQRPKGEWLECIDDRNGRRYGECPSCHKTTLNAIEYDLDGERHIMDFCPKCGCDCRGDKK